MVARLVVMLAEVFGSADCDRCWWRYLRVKSTWLLAFCGQGNCGVLCGLL